MLLTGSGRVQAAIRYYLVSCFTVRIYHMSNVTRLAPRRARGRPSMASAGEGLSGKAEYVTEFRKLGFTEYEAKAYLTLCQSSPATAYEVSKIAGLAKANVYQALEGLAQRGAVQPVSAAPVKYVPVEPSRLLGQIAKSTTAQCKQLADKLNHTKIVDGTDYVWMLNGDENIHIKIDEMIHRARKHIWIKAPQHLLERHTVALKRAAKRGIKMVMVLFGPPDCLTRFAFGTSSRVYLHEGSGVMIGPAPQLVTITIDFEEALTASCGESGHGVFTRSLPVVHLAESLLRHEVYLAEIFQKFGPKIEGVFGPALFKLREKYLRADAVNELKKNLGRG